MEKTASWHAIKISSIRNESSHILIIPWSGLWNAENTSFKIIAKNLEVDKELLWREPETIDNSNLITQRHWLVSGR